MIGNIIYDKPKPLLEEYFYGDEMNYKIAEDILYGRVDK